MFCRVGTGSGIVDAVSSRTKEQETRLTGKTYFQRHGPTTLPTHGKIVIESPWSPVNRFATTPGLLPLNPKTQTKTISAQITPTSNIHPHKPTLTAACFLDNSAHNQEFVRLNRIAWVVVREVAPVEGSTGLEVEPRRWPWPLHLVGSRAAGGSCRCGMRRRCSQRWTEGRRAAKSPR